jgi:hypothetical protein
MLLLIVSFIVWLRRAKSSRPGRLGGHCRRQAARAAMRECKVRRAGTLRIGNGGADGRMTD